MSPVYSMTSRLVLAGYEELASAGKFLDFLYIEYRSGSQIGKVRVLEGVEWT